jgi:hypothetical protein
VTQGIDLEFKPQYCKKKKKEKKERPKYPTLLFLDG